MSEDCVENTSITPDSSPQSRASASETMPGLMRAYWASQPRAVRFFDEDFQLRGSNVPNFAETYPIYKNGKDIPCEVPSGNTDFHVWPVQQVKAGAIRAERYYHLDGATYQEKACYRVQAWKMEDPRTGETLLVEETEPVSRESQQGCLEHLDREVEALLEEVVEYLEYGPNGALLRLRLTNHNLKSCWEVKGCPRRNCPAHGREDNQRCWEIPNTQCPDVPENRNSLTKFQYCNECEVFLLSCPDPLTRVAENLNRLIALLQMKYQEALEAQRVLQQADKMAVLGELLAGIAHEIKNPLGIIIGRLDILSLEMDSLTEEEVGADLGVIHEQADRVQKIIEHLLQMARANPTTLNRLSANEVISETLPMVRKILKDALIRTDLHLAEHLPAIDGDLVQLQQVLINLVINARDAMTPEGGVLTIATEAQTREGPGVAISVSDTGKGMEESALSKVFSPFYSTKLEDGGTGLGLTVCQRIMKQHQGRITVTSTPQQGTTFRLWFPVK